MTEPPAKQLPPAEAVSRILSEVNRLSDAVGLTVLIENLNAEAESVRQLIADLRLEYDQEKKDGVARIQSELNKTRDRANGEIRAMEAKKTKITAELKFLVDHIEKVRAEETERIEDLKTEHIKIKAARKALAEERRDFEGEKKRWERLSRSVRVMYDEIRQKPL